ALARASLAADHLADALQLVRDLLVGRHDFVERVRDLAVDAGQSAGQADAEVAAADLLKGFEEFGAVQDRGAGLGEGGAGFGADALQGDPLSPPGAKVLRPATLAHSSPPASRRWQEWRVKDTRRNEGEPPQPPGQASIGGASATGPRSTPAR